MGRWSIKPARGTMKSLMMGNHGVVNIAEYEAERVRSAHNADIDALTAENAEIQLRLDELVKMLEVPTKSQHKHGWLAYCEECWWRGEADDAKWDIDLDSDGYCPECGKVILEMVGDWSREKSIHARAVAIAEGRDNG